MYTFFFSSFLYLFLPNNSGDTIISNHISSHPLARIYFVKKYHLDKETKEQETLLFRFVVFFFELYTNSSTKTIKPIKLQQRPKRGKKILKVRIITNRRNCRFFFLLLICIWNVITSLPFFCLAFPRKSTKSKNGSE